MLKKTQGLLLEWNPVLQTAVGKCFILRRQDSPVLDLYFLSYPYVTLWCKASQTGLIGKHGAYRFFILKIQEQFNLSCILGILVYNNCIVLHKNLMNMDVL